MQALCQFPLSRRHSAESDVVLWMGEDAFGIYYGDFTHGGQLVEQFVVNGGREVSQ